MLFELINPSDPYVFEAKEFYIAVIAAWMLSSYYSVRPEGSDDYFGIPEFMEDPGKCYVEQFGISLNDVIEEHREEIIQALETITLGSFENYRRYQAAVKAIDDPDKLAAFRREWNDARSSMNDVVMRAEAAICALKQCAGNES